MQTSNEKTMLALKAASTEVITFVGDVEREVKALEDQYSSIVPDASTKSGYEHCKQVRAEVLPIKTKLEAARKELKSPILAAGKLIDSSLNPLIARIEAIYKPFEDKYREVDNAKKLKEEARQQQITDAMSAIQNAVLKAVGADSEAIQQVIDDLSDFDFDPGVFQERTNEATAAHKDAMDKLLDMLTDRIRLEQQQAEIAAFKAKEQEILEREQRLEQAAQQVTHQPAASIQQPVTQKQTHAPANNESIQQSGETRLLTPVEYRAIVTFVSSITSKEQSQFASRLKSEAEAYIAHCEIKEAA